MATNMPDEPEEIELSSPAFRSGQPIPIDYTADGRNISPPLKWASAPPGTQSLALICDDPDAPRGVFAHWVAYNLPADTMELDEGIPAEDSLPDGTTQGTNGFGKPGYGGPSPPKGKPHHYIFHLYALDTKLDLPSGADRAELAEAMEGHILGEGELTGTYGRSKG